MNRPKHLSLEIHVLNKLKGKVTLLLTDQEKRNLVNTALDEVLREEALGQYKEELSYDFHRTHFVENFFSYGIIEELLCDPEVEDIIINSLKPIYIHHAQKGFIPTPHHFASRQELDVFIQKLVIFSGRSGYNKIANIELSNLSGRVNIVDTPLGPQLTISKAKVDPLSVIDLIDAGSLSYELAAQLWLYMEGMSIRPANLIIAGGPGTGKTTLLNALMGFIPAKDRIVVIEDTLELNTFLDDSCSRLETDENLSLSDLVKNSLRMRPERVIVGEVRGEEARDMMTAVNIGKYCMCTIHALTAREAIIRLSTEPMKVPDMLINLMDVFVILKRYHVDGKLFRVVDEVSETGGFENAKVLLSQIYKYNYDQKKIVPTSPSTIYRDRLAQETGMSPRDVIVETWLRANVLKRLHEKKVRTMKEVITFCRFYSTDPIQAMHKIGLDREQMLREVKK